VLWESSTDRNGNGLVRYAGYTPNYLRVNVTVPADSCLENEIRSARIVSLAADGEAAHAELV